MKSFDFVIIGGGFFGVYTALYLRAKGYSIALVEQDEALMTRAAVVNQARLHTGYHYPRSIGTASLSNEYRQRFLQEHQSCINGHFKHYYALDAYQSFTDPAQFERFCENMGIPCKSVGEIPFLKRERLKAIYAVEEPGFDPDAIAAKYRKEIMDLPKVAIFTKETIIGASVNANTWHIQLQKNGYLSAGGVINATYAGTNKIQQIFGQAMLDVSYEISEICLANPGAFKGLALTVMDGPFCSYMPFGHSGLHSLSSVLYTHHAKSDQSLPVFSCQDQNIDCKPGTLANCSSCLVKPATAFEKMRKQLQQYVIDDCLPQYVESRFTVKTKLKASQIDDSRPTEIGQFQKNPAFYCIFAGKINAVYEIEKVLNL